MNSFPQTPANRLRKDSRKPQKIVVSTPVGVSALSRDSIVAKLNNKDYRTAYVESNIAHGLAHQVRVNRELRGWSQDELADKCGSTTKQATISRLEDPAYGKYSLSTLLKLASAFDVALVVKFVPYSKFLIETSDKSPRGLFARSFSDEDLYLRQATVTLTMVDEHYFQVTTQKTMGSGASQLLVQYPPSLRETFIRPLSFIATTTLPIEREYKNV